MGMFDYYQPSEKIFCPFCNVELNEWQGKDADCALLLWKQGQSYPEYSALICEEMKIPKDSSSNLAFARVIYFLFL